MAALPEGVALADGMTGVIIFAVVYAIVSIMAKIKQSQKGGAGDPPSAPKRPAQQPRRLPPRPQQQAGSRTTGNTQAEATKLEDLLRVLTTAAGVPATGGPVDRPMPTSFPSAEEVEERESLEVEEQVISLETTARRPPRPEFDHDDEIESVLQRRIRFAEARDRSLNREDHQAFDKRIRTVEPDKTRVAKPRHISLRQAVVWREILGPPLGLRNREDSDL